MAEPTSEQLQKEKCMKLKWDAEPDPDGFFYATLRLGPFGARDTAIATAEAMHDHIAECFRAAGVPQKF